MARDHTAQYLPREAIDLTRLVRRLDASIHEETWDGPYPGTTWMKAQSTLQKVTYARSLLKKVSTSGEEQSPTTTQRLDDIRAKLDRVEEFAKEVAERTEPKSTRPAPIFPTLPRPAPTPPSEPINPSTSEPILSPPAHESELETTTDDLLPTDPSSSTNFSFPTPMTLIPPTLPTTSTSTTTAVAPRYLQTSNALHQELSEQLAQMAAQLKRNAHHFSETLGRDQAVVEDVKQKLEGNFDVMQKERVRLGDHGGKSGSTTWLVVGIIGAVLVLFLLMIAIIRVT